MRARSTLTRSRSPVSAADLEREHVVGGADHDAVHPAGS